jgi:hypothetical protein
VESEISARILEKKRIKERNGRASMGEGKPRKKSRAIVRSAQVAMKRSIWTKMVMRTMMKKKMSQWFLKSWKGGGGGVIFPSRVSSSSPPQSSTAAAKPASAKARPILVPQERAKYQQERKEMIIFGESIAFIDRNNMEFIHSSFVNYYRLTKNQKNRKTTYSDSKNT